MNFTESTAKNGEKTFSIDSVFFHSSYAPSREAERIVNSIPVTCNPEVIILIEPGFDYSYSFLKSKYPETKIGIIRLIPEIKETSWDFIINFSEYCTSEKLKNYLVTHFTETQMLSSVMYSWPTAEKLFSDNCNFIWQEYKNALIYEKTILVTRQYFEKKWFINSINFIKNTQNSVSIKKHLSVPVVITASGPSLKASLSVLKDNRSKFFLIALSSSLTCLLNNNITPDLVMTTDGGYWAGEHLKQLKKYKDISVGAVTEAYVPKEILRNNPILQLGYKDSLINSIIPEVNSFTEVQRNGTISGTALEFAKKLTDKEIYFCGLDLQENNGYQHTQPNELEANNCLKDIKLKSKEKRLYPGSFKSESLQIYRSWFENYKKSENVFRIMDLDNNKALGTITDINSKDFNRRLLNLAEVSETIISFEASENNSIIKAKLSEVHGKLLENDFWLKQLFPIDYLSINHAINEEDKSAAMKILNTKKEKLLKQIQKIYE